MKSGYRYIVTIEDDSTEHNHSVALKKEDKSTTILSFATNIMGNQEVEFELKEDAPYLLVYASGRTQANIKICLKKIGKFNTLLNTVNIENEIECEWGQGTFDGSGAEISSNSRIRTNSIIYDKKYIYVAVIPEGFKIAVNYFSISDNKRINSIYFDCGTTITNGKDYIKFIIKKNDDSNFSYDSLSDEEKRELKIYKIKKGVSYDATISASDSENTNSDIICNGTNDQSVLQALLNCTGSISIMLRGGTYHLSKLYTTTFGQKCALHTYDTNISNNKIFRSVTIHGEKSTRAIDEHAVKFYCGMDINSFSEDDENSIILVPRRNTEMDTSDSSNTIINIKNICIIGCGYTKPIVYMDMTQAKASAIEHVCIRADGSKSGLSVFQTKPNEECVGIRVGHGSNNGIQNYVKHCMVIYCGKGYSICGEHFVFEDCLAHHCYIGFAFGDIVTRGNFEHPNILIGCSIEGCYRLMLLTKNGIMEEKDFVKDSSTDMFNSTLICIGLSTETKWDIPLDEQTESNKFLNTKPVLEILKGCYRGRIELDYNWIPVEDGSCTNMKYTAYGSTIITN